MRLTSLIVATAVVLASVAPARATPGADLDNGRAAYKAQNWDQAFKTLNSLVHPHPELARQEDLWEAYVLVGASLYHLGKRARAVEEFKRALDIDIDRTITTQFHSADVVQLYEDTKARVKAEHELERRRREQAAREQRIRDYINTIGVYERNSYAVNFLPFAAQIQNKQRTKAYIFGGAMLVTGGVSLGTFVYLAGTYGLEAKIPLKDGPRVRRLQQIEIGTGIAFFGIYIAGVIDAIRNYKSNRLIKGDDSLIPPDLRPAPAEKPARPTKSSRRRTRKSSFLSRLHFGPMVTPGGAGIGLSWEND